MPRVRALSAQTTISITALDSPPNLLREPYDLSIFYETQKGSPHRFEIGNDSIFPVCAPSIALRLKKPADLDGELFLHDVRWTGHWRRWLDEVAPGLEIDTTGPTFSLYSLAVQEAQNGAGILMGHEQLVRDFLDEGSLAAPFTQAVELPRKLVIASPYPLREGSLLRKIVTLLRTGG